MALPSFINATDARKNFFGLLAKVKKGPYPVNITVKGIPEAVIMSKEEFDGFVATIETLSDPGLMRSIRQSEKDLAAGRFRSWKEVKKELGLVEKKYVSGKTVKSSRKRSQKT